MIGRARQRLEQHPTGLLVALFLATVFSYTVIWILIEPLGIEGRLNTLSCSRSCLYIIGTLLLGAYITIAIELIFRLRNWNSLQKSIQLQERKDCIPLEEFLKDARKVDILGINLVGIITHYQGLIEEKAKSGCEFRFIVTDPALMSTIPVSLQTKQNLEHAIRLLEHMKGKSNRIKVGFLPFIPTYSLLIRDPDHTQGTIQVEIYCQVEIFGAVPMEYQRPNFVIGRKAEWFDYFCNEFSRAWDASHKPILR